MIKLFNISILLSQASQSLVITVDLSQKSLLLLNNEFWEKAKNNCQGNYPPSNSSSNYRNTTLKFTDRCYIVFWKASQVYSE